MQNRLIVVLMSVAGLAAAGDVAGKWKMSASAPDDKIYTFELTVKTGATPSASFENQQFGLLQMRDVTVKGDELTFKMPHQQEGLIQVRLKLEGDALKGEFQIPAGDKGTITGQRADAASRWKIVVKRDGGDMNLSLALSDEAGKLSGTLAPEGGSPMPLTDVARTGNSWSFKLSVDGQAYALKCTLDGDKLAGEYQAPNGKSGPFTGVRQ